jgi:DNA polymerase III epsilon subunit-like protein
MNARLQAIQSAREKVMLKPLYLDTETTGRERYSEIIEICIIDDLGQVVFESLVKPSRPIPQEAIRIHGITNEMVKDASSWMVVWPQVHDILAGRHVGIYNADFDLQMIKQTLDKYRMRLSTMESFSSFCIMKLYAQYYGEWNSKRGSYRWHSLEDAGRQCRISLPNTHRALDDSLLARAVLHYMASDSTVSR